MAHIRDEMSFFLRLAVLGLGTEIMGGVWRSAIRQKSSHNTPGEPRATSSRGPVTMATVSKPAGLSEMSSLQKAERQSRAEAAGAFPVGIDLSTRLMDCVSGWTDSEDCRSHKNLSVGVYAAAPGTTSDVRAPLRATQNTLVSSRLRKFEKYPKTRSSPTALIPPVQRSGLKRSDQLMGTSAWTSSCFICREGLNAASAW